MSDDLRASIGALPLFEGVDGDRLDRFFSLIAACSFDPGETVVAEGDPAEHFGLVITGAAAVTYGPENRPIGTAGPGSIIGELGLLRSERRNATVTANTPMRMVLGGHDALSALLDIDDVRVRLSRQAAQHAAGSVSSVTARLPDDSVVVLRPILPDHADAFRQALDRLSPETRRLRFFTAAPLPPSLIQYLTDLDYRNHFAWVVTPVDGERRAGMASGRFVRQADRPDTAEIALAVADEHQRRGLGRLLLGAIGVAGDEAGVQRFEGEILRDNRASLGLFETVDAERIDSDRTAVRMQVTPTRLVAEIDPDVAAELRAVSAEVLRLARVAIAPPG